MRVGRVSETVRTVYQDLPQQPAPLPVTQLWLAQLDQDALSSRGHVGLLIATSAELRKAGADALLRRHNKTNAPATP